MLFARKRILAGIVVVSAVAWVVPEAAYAVEGCTSGSVALGGVQTYQYTLDSTQMAKLTLSSASDSLTMHVVDDQSNVACETSLPNSGHQVCSWQPASGATYTVQVLLPASAATLAGSSDGSVSAISNSDTAGAPPASSVNELVSTGPVAGLGVRQADFQLCSVHVN